jgi:hypothetical protein
VNAQHVDDAQILACGALGTASKTYVFPANGTVAVAAALIFTAAQPLRERLLGEMSGSPILATMRDDRVYLACCYVALFGQAVHAALTDWWLDTAIDVLVVVLVVSRLSNVAFVGCEQAACSGGCHWSATGLKRSIDDLAAGDTLGHLEARWARKERSAEIAARA